jgi:hypothetical protein
MSAGMIIEHRKHPMLPSKMTYNAGTVSRQWAVIPLNSTILFVETGNKDYLARTLSIRNIDQYHFIVPCKLFRLGSDEASLHCRGGVSKGLASFFVACRWSLHDCDDGTTGCNGLEIYHRLWAGPQTLLATYPRPSNEDIHPWWILSAWKRDIQKNNNKCCCCYWWLFMNGMVIRQPTNSYVYLVG